MLDAHGIISHVSMQHNKNKVLEAKIEHLVWPTTPGVEYFMISPAGSRPTDNAVC